MSDHNPYAEVVEELGPRAREFFRDDYKAWLVTDRWRRATRGHEWARLSTLDGEGFCWAWWDGESGGAIELRDVDPPDRLGDPVAVPRDLVTAAAWSSCFSDVSEAQDWVGMRTPGAAEDWRRALPESGQTVDQAVELARLGFTPDDLRRSPHSDWVLDALRGDLEHLVPWWRQWVDNTETLVRGIGVSSPEILATLAWGFLSDGLRDPWETAEWREAVVYGPLRHSAPGNNHWVDYGSARQQVAIWAGSDMSVAEAAQWTEAGVKSPSDAAAWIAHLFPPSEARGYVAAHPEDKGLSFNRSPGGRPLEQAVRDRRMQLMLGRLLGQLPPPPQP